MPTEYERRRQRIADAARPWKIDRSGAPSPRGYIQLVNRTIRQWRRQVYAALGLNRTADAEDPKPKTPAERAAESLREQEQAREHARRLQLLRLVPPSPTEVEAVGKPAARVAMRTARRSVQAAGVPLAEVALRLGVEVPLVLGVDIAATLGEQTALTAWSRAGTDLIRSVGQDLVAGLDAEIADAARRGVLARDLRSLVDDRLGVGARHAQFIARDQIAKLNGKITEATHKAAGITAYKWRASRDQRTRDDHRALDGTIQQWDTPPVVDQRTGRTGHPGDDFQCRCVAIPVVGEVERAAPPEREPPPVVDVPVRRPPPRKRQPAAAPVAPPPPPGLEHLSAREQSLLGDLSIQTQRDPTSYLKAFGAKKPAEQAALLAPLLEQGLVEQTEAGLRVTERYRDLRASRPLTEAQLQALLGL